MSKLMDLIHQELPKFNPTIAEGVAVSQMEGAETYIDNIMKLSAQSFPPGLTYEGYVRCTVEEEFDIISEKKTQNHTLELAPSSLYLVKYLFKYKGENLIPRPIYLPFVDKGGMITFRSKQFIVMPVLADQTLSVAKEGIFVPFLSAKVTFKQMQYWFKMNGIQKNHDLIWSKIYNREASNQPRRSTRADLSVRANCTMAHYLFCKYGVREVFRRFCGIEDLIILNHRPSLDDYPREQYTICSSSGIRPRGVKNKDYTPTRIHLVIPNDRLNSSTLGMVTGLFYVLDHYTHRFDDTVFEKSDDSQEQAENISAEIRLWRILLGRIIFSNKDSDGQMELKINDHIESLDQYVDDTTKDGLDAQGYQVDDLYDLMAILVADFTKIYMETNVASMYGKQLAVLRYVLSEIVKAISVFKYKLVSIRNRELTAADINKYSAKFLKPELIFTNLSKHNEITSEQCSDDNMMFKYTSRVILQEKATGLSSKKSSASFKDPSKLLDVSIAEAGSILDLPKTEPTGRIALNPFLKIDKSYKIRQSEELKPLINEIRKHIVRG